jgi:nicotinamidase/pyrazinamidase
LPGGALAVPRGDEIIPLLNRYIAAFLGSQRPIFATRDWHPPDHCSFRAQGGIWPPHCIRQRPGADFSAALRLPPATIIISKGIEPVQEAYSGFEGTDLAERLRAVSATRLYVGGLATDYCVRNTVTDALRLGFRVFLLSDAIRAVNLKPDDGRQAEAEMLKLGAIPLSLTLESQAQATLLSR